MMQEGSQLAPGAQRPMMNITFDQGSICALTLLGRGASSGEAAPNIVATKAAVELIGMPARC